MNNNYSEMNEDTNKEDKSSVKKMRDDYMSDIRKQKQDNLFAGSRFRNTVIPGVQNANLDFDFLHIQHHPMNRILIAKIQEWSSQNPQPELLYSFLELIRSSNILEQHQGIIGLRRILSNKASLPIRQILDHSALYIIIAMTKNQEEPHLQLEATWCLANLASGSTEETYSLIKKNIISIFVQLSKSTLPQIAEQAIWGLGNISGDCTELRTMVLKSEAPSNLLELIESSPVEKIKNLIIWVFSNICRLKPDRESVSQNISKMLTKLVTYFTNSNSVEVQNDALLGMSKVVKGPSVVEFAKKEFLSKLLIYYNDCLCSYEINSTKIQAIHTILGALTSSTHEHTMMVVEAGFLTPLCVILGVSQEDRLKESCWILSNIAIGEPVQIQRLISEPGLFQKIAQLSDSASVEISKEALWIICNLTLTKDESILRFLIDSLGILNIFNRNLNITNDSKKIGLIIEAIRELFEYFALKVNPGDENPLALVMKQNGISRQLEMLQYHRSENLYIKVLGILERFFILEECS